MPEAERREVCHLPMLPKLVWDKIRGHEYGIGDAEEGDGPHGGQHPGRKEGIRIL